MVKVNVRLDQMLKFPNSINHYNWVNVDDVTVVCKKCYKLFRPRIGYRFSICMRGVCDLEFKIDNVCSDCI